MQAASVFEITGAALLFVRPDIRRAPHFLRNSWYYSTIFGVTMKS
jgi:hypothetical protein